MSKKYRIAFMKAYHFMAVVKCLLNLDYKWFAYRVTSDIMKIFGVERGKRRL
jgi:hypothetical protein